MMADDEGALPDSARHVAEPAAIPAAPSGPQPDGSEQDFEALNRFASAMALEGNRIGLNLWVRKEEYPDPSNPGRYRTSPGSLPECWGISPDKFLPEREKTSNTGTGWLRKFSTPTNGGIGLLTVKGRSYAGSLRLSMKPEIGL